jgi:hypothetical protein
MTTIVTSYFKLEQSKKNHETYLTWMQNMLIIQSPMVIFCDKDSKKTIEDFRKDRLTHIIVLDFTDFYTYKYLNAFENDYKTKDHEKFHNAYLYLIWNEKTNFLKRAIELNPFVTDTFLWCDIGCFRRKNTHFIHWPNSTKIPNDKILLLLVNPFPTNVYESCNILEKLPDFQFSNGYIGGTIFGGSSQTILIWHEKYYQMLEYFISINRFIGKDQNIMDSVVIMNKDLVYLVEPKSDYYDPWFYLHKYLL